VTAAPDTEHRETRVVIPGIQSGEGVGGKGVTRSPVAAMCNPGKKSAPKQITHSAEQTVKTVLNKRSQSRRRKVQKEDNYEDNQLAYRFCCCELYLR
jgi:hypothetical protein